MNVLSQQEQRVVDLFRQIEPSRWRNLLLALARCTSDTWKQSQGEGESRLRELARQAGLDWDKLDDTQRQDFIEQLLDGDRA